MHHLTTLNLPTPSQREQDRANIDDALEAFLQRGGELQQIEPGVSSENALGSGRTRIRKIWKIKPSDASPSDYRLTGGKIKR